MSTVGQYGDYASGIILNAGVDNLTNQQATLSWENSTGVTSETFSGLGDNNSSVVFNTTPKITQINAWKSNITNVQSNLTMINTSLKDIISVAQKMSSSLLSLKGDPDSLHQTSLAALSQQADSDLTEIGNDLNVSSGNGYAFATGFSPFDAPIKDISSLTTSNLYNKIHASVMSLQNGVSASTVMQEATNYASDNSSDMSIFSPSLSVPPSSAASAGMTVSIGDSSSNNVQYGFVATQSLSTNNIPNDPSTGSPIRDIMRDMMIASSMKDISNTTPGYKDLVSQLGTSLNSSINQVIEVEQNIGVEQNYFKSQSSLLSSTSDMLNNNLDNARNVDAAKVATEYNQVNSTLQASYIMISKMKNLSLANYI